MKKLFQKPFPQEILNFSSQGIKDLDFLVENKK
jgi:hypothetical protein